MLTGSGSSSEVTSTDNRPINKYCPREVGRLNDMDPEAQTRQPKPKLLASTRYAILTIYRRLFTLVFLANTAVFVTVMTKEQKLLALVNATAANLLVCGMARQPLVVNAIFLVVCSIPRSAPLPLRKIAAKVYHYGGVHSGCGVASLVWYVGFVGILSNQYWGTTAGARIRLSTTPVMLVYIILVLLLAIIAVAHPTFRLKRHDCFELTHRFLGWIVVALFSALLMIFAHEASLSLHKPLGTFLVTLPAFWFLVATAVSIIQPWLFLRKVAVRAEPLSTHAIRLHFDHTKTAFAEGIQLAKHPLRDWHGFATFPDTAAETDQPSTFSCLVSKAGDWTADTIQKPPAHLWKRGVLTQGFAYAMRVFHRVIVVTTGSGIGPCLSFLGDENRPALRVLWQTRAPLETYGEGVMGMVRQMDYDPIIMDTTRCGRTDMVPIIFQQVREFDAEAVCVISNPLLTKRILYELEARGIPAFGPIFDS